MEKSAQQASGIKQLTKLIEQISYTHNRHEVFHDWVEMMALSISNSCDKVHYEEREKQYMQIVKKYNQNELNKFGEAFASLIHTMDQEGLGDILGEIFHELELHSKYQGQFFSPYHLSKMMGEMVLDAPEWNEKGYVTVCEPCCGSGVLILGAADTYKRENRNYQKQMVVLANDIDSLCVHMCYVQLSLYGIPAVVQHGNSLTLEVWSRWYTPIYIIDRWIFREQMTFTTAWNEEDEKIKCWLEPMYYLLKYKLRDFEVPNEDHSKIAKR